MPRFRVPILLLALVLAACQGGPAPGPAPGVRVDTTLVDALGRSVTLSVPLQGVASLAPSITEMLVLAAGPGAVAGITTADDHPVSILQKPAYSALPVDFETLVSLQPDAVFASTQVNAPRDAETFGTLGLPEVFFETRRVQDIPDGIRLMGRLLGTGQRANGAADSLEARLQTLHQVTDAVQHRPRVLVLISPATPWSFGPESYVHDLLQAAGAESVTADFPNEAPVLSEEFVLDAAPDAILVTFPSDDPAADLVENHPAWAAVPAIASGRVYVIPADHVLRAGPRIVEAAWDMARALHPELTKDIP